MRPIRGCAAGQGMVFVLSVLNRVICNFAPVFPKQGNKIEGLVLKRVCILGLFCPKQGQGFKPSAAHLYPETLVKYPPGSKAVLDCLTLYDVVIHLMIDHCRMHFEPHFVLTAGRSFFFRSFVLFFFHVFCSVCFRFV